MACIRFFEKFTLASHGGTHVGVFKVTFRRVEKERDGIHDPSKGTVSSSLAKRAAPSAIERSANRNKKKTRVSALGGKGI